MWRSLFAIFVLLAGAGSAEAESHRGFRFDVSQLYRAPQPLTDADGERRSREFAAPVCGSGLAERLGISHGRVAFFSSSESECPGDSGFIGSTDGKSIRFDLRF